MSGRPLRGIFKRHVTTTISKAAALGMAAAMALPAFTAPAAAHHNNGLDLHEPQTTYSRDVESLRQKFNAAAKDINVVIIDRDWLQINAALNQKPGTDNEEVKQRVLSEFIEKRAGHVFSPQDLAQIVARFSAKTGGSAYTNANRAPNGQPRVCVVYGHNGQMDATERLRDFTAAKTGVHGPIADAPMQNVPDLETINKMTDYHEIGHCLDRWYQPAASRAYARKNAHDAYIAARHRSEMFGDVFALLMIARDGTKDADKIAEMRGNMRLAATALKGPLIAKFPAKGSNGAEDVFVYAIHDGAFAVRDLIRQKGVAAFQTLSIDEVADLARTIVDQNALAAPEAKNAVVELITNRHDLSALSQQAATDSAAKDRLAIAQHIRAQMNDALTALFDYKPAAGNDVLATIPYDFKKYVAGPKPDMAVIEQKTLKIADEVMNGAGGRSANRTDLVRSYSAFKDRQRAILQNGNESERVEAVERLALAGPAFLYVARELGFVERPDAKQPAHNARMVLAMLKP